MINSKGSKGLGQHYFPYDPTVGSWPFPAAETGPGFFSWWDNIGIPQVGTPPVEPTMEEPPGQFEVSVLPGEGGEAPAVAEPQPQMPMPQRQGFNWIWILLLGIGAYYFWLKGK